jgi:protein involved in polysaccharide export with SLBB domain
MSMIKLCKRAGRWAAVCGLLAAGCLLAGCHSPSPSPSVADPPSPATPGGSAFAPVPFRPGDKVTIIFGDLPSIEPAHAVQVREDGTVTLLQNKTFTFAGKRPGVLEQEIRDFYVPRYYKYMTVNIQPEAQTLFYYVDGEVKTPARQTYIERTTVLKAIASASGFTDFAKKSAVTLTRLDGRKYTINCKKARVHPELDLEVYPGDKIYVPRKLW